MKTSQGLIELLLRLGITPTHEITEDIELSKEGMARPFKGHTGLYPYGEFYGISKFRENFWRSPLTKTKSKE
jgi:hypothetical protein